MLDSAEDIGLSLVVLSLVFACAVLIRRWSKPLRKLFMPTAVIGGFLVLGLGPEGMGRLLGGSGVFPNDVFAVWRQLPGVLITVMSASLPLGERLSSLRTVWSISGSHVINDQRDVDGPVRTRRHPRPAPARTRFRNQQHRYCNRGLRKAFTRLYIN